jgi:hypothetical protein
MAEKPRQFVRTLLICAGVGAVFGAASSFFAGDWLSGAFKAAKFSGADVLASSVLILWIVVAALSVVFFTLSGISPKIGERAGIVQLLGGGKRGRAVLLPMTLVYLGNGGLLALIVWGKIWGIEPQNGTVVMGLGIVFATMMVFAAYQCWILLDELLRIIWIESCAISLLISLLLVMMTLLASLSGLSFNLSGYHALAAYHAIYLVVYFWLTAVRAPEMLTNPLAEEA